MIESREFVLVVIVVLLPSLVTATTLSLVPINVNASTEDEENDDDRNDDRALTQTITQNKDGETRVKNIESNENSENAAVKITRSSDHEVDKEDRSDDPAHTGTIVFEEDGKVVKEITQESAPQSSKAKGQTSQAHIAISLGDSRTN